MILLDLEQTIIPSYIGMFQIVGVYINRHKSQCSLITFTDTKKNAFIIINNQLNSCNVHENGVKARRLINNPQDRDNRCNFHYNQSSVPKKKNNQRTFFTACMKLHPISYTSKAHFSLWNRIVYLFIANSCSWCCFRVLYCKLFGSATKRMKL